MDRFRTARFSTGRQDQRSAWRSVLTGTLRIASESTGGVQDSIALESHRGVRDGVVGRYAARDGEQRRHERGAKLFAGRFRLYPGTSAALGAGARRDGFTGERERAVSAKPRRPKIANHRSDLIGQPKITGRPTLPSPAFRRGLSHADRSYSARTRDHSGKRRDNHSPW